MITGTNMRLAFGILASEQSDGLFLWKTFSHVYYDYDILLIIPK